MILSMLAVLLIFALINGLLVYFMVEKSDAKSVVEFNEVLRKSEEDNIDSWLGFARSIIHPYLAFSHKYPDSLDTYKEKVLEFLGEANWHNERGHYGFYFIFDADNGNAILFRDSLGNILPRGKNVFEIEDANGKKFAREIMERAYASDTSHVKFTYSKPCVACAPTERMAKGLYIQDWRWVVATGGYTERLVSASENFSKEFNKNRLNLMANLLGIMLISFLVGLFMVFKQMNSFVTSLRSLSHYIHRLATKGIRFEDFDMSAKSPAELRSLVEDLNVVVHNVGAFIESVRTSADRVSDLSGACADMLDIVDYDAKLVGQRTAEMAAASGEVVDNVSNMAVGIEEIKLNVDGLKKLASCVTTSTIDIKPSVSQMSIAMKELNYKSCDVQTSVMSVTQAVNDIDTESVTELDKINNISKSVAELHSLFEKMTERTGELRKCATKTVSSITKERPLGAIKEMCDIIDELYEKIMAVQSQLANLQENQIIPLAQIVKDRQNLSKEISADALELRDSTISMVASIAEINSSTQHINAKVEHVASDIDETCRNVDKIGVSTNSMNEYAKQVRIRMNEFSLKSKRVEEAHSAIEHTLIDAKDSMKSLNDLSANLRKVVDDLVRLDGKTQKVKAIQF